MTVGGATAQDGGAGVANPVAAFNTGFLEGASSRDRQMVSPHQLWAVLGIG